MAPFSDYDDTEVPPDTPIKFDLSQGETLHDKGRLLGVKLWSPALEQWPTSNAYRGRMSMVNMMAGYCAHVEGATTSKELWDFFQGVQQGLEDTSRSSKPSDSVD